MFETEHFGLIYENINIYTVDIPVVVDMKR